MPKKFRTMTPSQKKDTVIANLQREVRVLEKRLREAIADRDALATPALTSAQPR